ncbi:MAG: ABC transporter ATP-binding protein [Candidatus Competibacteraceae bacterium]|nr:MAG: ABC transporter ATP-binding protein [Candidatus Competibacteraceae bacterium]
MTAVVEVAGLHKRFGEVRAVDDVSFAVGAHEFFSLLGPSGCGKTTTLRCVAGLESADRGAIRIGDRIVFDRAGRVDLPPNQRAIGMVFQSYAVWPHMSVFDNIAYPLKVQGRARAVIADRVARVLEILGMRGLERRMPGQLSGGQQQRVALGRALALEPAVLLLDEPLSNLDAKLREQMRAELKLLQKDTGLPILYVTHDQTEALAMSDRIAVMSEGRIHQLAGPSDIYRRPATQFVLDFIGTVNYVPCRLEDPTADPLRLILADGQACDLPRPSFVPAAGDVLLAVRPEDIAIGPDGRGLMAEVELGSFLGHANEYRVRLGDRVLRVVGDKQLNVAEGTTVGLTVRDGLLLERDALERPLARAS